MAKYQYKSVAFPAVIKTDNNYEEVMHVYNNVLNDNAVNGWELDYIDTITTHQSPGCVGGYGENVTLKIAIFRKPA